VFVLVAGDTGGFVGRGVRTGLTFAFGRLAFLAPLALFALTVTTVFEIKLRRSFWFAGAMVFLFGLFVLLAGGFPPIDGHDSETFVRSVFEARAGGLGEAVYALLHRLVGVVGVSVIGWITLLAGFSLATGVTVRRLGRGTRRAALAVRATAERTTQGTRRRMDMGDGEWPRGSEGDASSEAAGPRLGPIDLVSGAEVAGAVAGEGVAGPNPFGGEFDEWSDGRPASMSPVAPLVGERHGGAPGVLDGATAFADIYGASVSTGGESTGRSMVSTSGPAGADGEAGSAVAEGGAFTAARQRVGADAEESRSASTVSAVSALTVDVDSEDGMQETLPGLAREPRQIELAVDPPVYLLPEAELLRKSVPPAIGKNSGERDTAAILLQALSQFGVEARVIGMVVGPRVTRYELQLAPGTKVSKVTNLRDDLAYALASTEIRILAPIPGKSAVGVEVPNQRPDFVTLGDIYREFPKSAGPLMVWLGKDISGKAVYTDLTRLPHLLIAGTTGSGKSGCVNCLVSSILLRSTPEQVRMIMIDPKKVELSHYDRIPHLLVPVVTNMKDAAGVLHNVAKEMEERYELMELEHSRNLGEMNKARLRRGERPLPYILVVVDELADLMMVSPQEVEGYVIRLAQKSRAVGIHLVVATQRPSADVITGMIKANIPSRIAFAVSSQTDSRVILDVNGAETLLGMGDMLFKPLGSSHLQRVQGAYITEEEIAILVNHWRHQAEPEFREELLRRPAETKGERGEDDSHDPDSDDLLADAALLVIETGSASVSMLQRRLRVGYTRAGRLIDMLERRGIVGPWEGSKPRQILIEADEFDHVMAGLRSEERGDDGTEGE